MKFLVEIGTAVMVDMVGYSVLAAKLERQGGATSVALLNIGIKSRLRKSLINASGDMGSNFVISTGDGALLFFSSVDQALIFTKDLLGAPSFYGVPDRSGTEPPRQFRVGVGTGEIAVDTETTEGRGLSGMAIVRAARLESSAHPQSALIDSNSWHAATAVHQALYAGPQSITGKHDERFDAYRLAFPPLASQPSPPTERGRLLPRLEQRLLMKGIFEKFDRLTRAAQIDMVALRLTIPLSQRPPDTLTMERRINAIVEWAETELELANLDQLLSTMAP